MNLSKGVTIVLDNEPYEVLEVEHSRFAQRRAVLRTKVRNLITDNVYNKTFQSNENFEKANVVKEKAQYLYRDNDLFHFMNEKNYEQFSLNKKKIEEKAKFLLEGTTVEILFFNEQPISLSLPIKMKFKVINAPPGIKGDTAQGGNKTVTIVTGQEVVTPLFIHEGDTILVDTRTGEYVEKVN